jgi:hypothetical protein
MINTPDWGNAFCFALPVRQDQISQSVEGESDVFQAAACGNFWLSVWYPYESDSVMLFIVADEGKHVVAVYDFPSKEVNVEARHMFELRGA